MYVRVGGGGYVGFTVRYGTEMSPILIYGGGGQMLHVLHVISIAVSLSHCGRAAAGIFDVWPADCGR